MIAQWECVGEIKSIDDDGQIVGEEVRTRMALLENGYAMPPKIGEGLLVIREYATCPLDVTPRTRVLDTQTLDHVYSAITLLENKLGTIIESVTFWRDAREFHLIDQQGTAYWMDLSADPDQQLAKLKLAIGDYPDLLKPMQYIDLRVPDKIYYLP